MFWVVCQAAVNNHDEARRTWRKVHREPEGDLKVIYKTQ